MLTAGCVRQFQSGTIEVVPRSVGRDGKVQPRRVWRVRWVQCPLVAERCNRGAARVWSVRWAQGGVFSGRCKRGAAAKGLEGSVGPGHVRQLRSGGAERLQGWRAESYMAMDAIGAQIGKIANVHTKGGARRRPGHGKGRGRRISTTTCTHVQRGGLCQTNRCQNAISALLSFLNV